MIFNGNRTLSARILKQYPLLCYSVFPMLLFCGCESLPPGDPPVGPIVDQGKPNVKIVPVDKAVNQMTTSLSAACIRHNLRGTAVLKLFADSYSNKVFRQTALITGIFPASGKAKPQLMLISKFIRQPEIMLWEMRLITPVEQKVIWQDKITVSRHKF